MLWKYCGYSFIWEIWYFIQLGYVLWEGHTESYFKKWNWNRIHSYQQKIPGPCYESGHTPWSNTLQWDGLQFYIRWLGPILYSGHIWKALFIVMDWGVQIIKWPNESPFDNFIVSLLGTQNWNAIQFNWDTIFNISFFIGWPQHKETTRSTGSLAKET